MVQEYNEFGFRCYYYQEDVEIGEDIYCRIYRLEIVYEIEVEL